MVLKAISSKVAAQLDQELMSTGAFSIDQLMELAGLAVAQAIYKEYPPATFRPTSKPVLFLIGPGNNGGDGLVAARHLKLWGVQLVYYYPKKSANNQLYKNLVTQLADLGVPEVTSLDEVVGLVDGGVSLIIDALFGFSFKPPARDPFSTLLTHLAANSDKIAPIISVDIPSGWDVDDGPGKGDIMPSMLISLTAPKPCAANFGGSHYLGGRFINEKIAEKYGIKDLVGRYKGNEMVVKL
jgi:NAD(P)H-hydrate epimerase